MVIPLGVVLIISSPSGPYCQDITYFGVYAPVTTRKYIAL